MKKYLVLNCANHPEFFTDLDEARSFAKDTARDGRVIRYVYEAVTSFTPSSEVHEQELSQ